MSQTLAQQEVVRGVEFGGVVQACRKLTKCSVLWLWASMLLTRFFTDLRASVDWSSGCGKWRQVFCLGPFTLEEGWILRSSSCLKPEKYVCSQTNRTLFLQSSLCSRYLTCFTTFIVSIIPDKEDTIIILIFLKTKIEFLVLVSGAIFSFTLRQNHV